MVTHLGVRLGLFSAQICAYVFAVFTVAAGAAARRLGHFIVLHVLLLVMSLALLTIHKEVHVATLCIYIAQLVLQIAGELLEVRLNAMYVELVLHVKLTVAV